jgi:hypothetical protein
METRKTGRESRGKSYLVHAWARLLAKPFIHLHGPSNVRAKFSYAMYINGKREVPAPTSKLKAIWGKWQDYK